VIAFFVALAVVCSIATFVRVDLAISVFNRRIDEQQKYLDLQRDLNLATQKLLDSQAKVIEELVRELQRVRS